LRILDRAGKGNPPMAGDEHPAGWQEKPVRKATKRTTSGGRKKRTSLK
jgi:hypothetical protein